MSVQIIDKLTSELEQSIIENRTYKKSYIYLVEDDKIAKCRNERSSRAEHKWGTYLFENGVQVPETYGLIHSDVNSIERLFVVMQRINGKEIYLTSGWNRRKAIKQYRAELEKILDLGIYPSNSLWGENSILGEDGKLYLIDFEDWKEGSKDELDIFYKRIKKWRIKFEGPS